MEKFGINMLKKTKPILKDLGTYLTKVRILRKHAWSELILSGYS